MALRSPLPSVNNNTSDPLVDVKCDKCCVVINELLALINNKVETLPETSILQICLSSYSLEEIETARAVAYKLLAPNKRIMRRKEGAE
ncbi:unnamed protein product [Arctia plantaginis]|uniref:Uncharacterized protein n=1 Tax=Arctia plantaginis TaxID=874455 RepID=A0A8S1B7L0_ARCPL|nr:unnamed protein product [Arctia plantaginis]